MTLDKIERLQVLGRRIMRAQAIIQSSTTESMGLLSGAGAGATGRGSVSNLVGSGTEPDAVFNRPLVDDVGMALIWRGERCPLGYSRLLDLVQRLVRNPDRWIPYDRLLKEVWKDSYLSEGTIKVAVTRLKAKLASHGMIELAKMIRTSGYRCGYFPNGKPD